MSWIELIFAIYFIFAVEVVEERAAIAGVFSSSKILEEPLLNLSRICFNVVRLVTMLAVVVVAVADELDSSKTNLTCNI